MRNFIIYLKVRIFLLGLNQLMLQGKITSRVVNLICSKIEVELEKTSKELAEYDPKRANYYSTKYKKPRNVYEKGPAKKRTIGFSID